MKIHHRLLKWGGILTLLFWLLSPWLSFSISAAIMNLTGWLCVVVILGFWLLPSLRTLQFEASSGPIGLHEWLGVALLIPLAIHGSQYGNGWMFMLGIALLSSLLFGLQSPRNNPPDHMDTTSTIFLERWWWMHIVLGFLCTGLIALHVWYVVAYA